MAQQRNGADSNCIEGDTVDKLAAGDHKFHGNSFTLLVKL